MVPFHDKIQEALFGLAANEIRSFSRSSRKRLDHHTATCSQIVNISSIAPIIGIYLAI